jgi:hypothetical protein
MYYYIYAIYSDNQFKTTLIPCYATCITNFCEQSRSSFQRIVLMKNQGPDFNTLTALLVFRARDMERGMRNSSRSAIQFRVKTLDENDLIRG